MESLKGRALRVPICGARFMKPYKEGPANSSVPGGSSGSHQSVRLEGFSPLGCTQTPGRVQRSLTWSDIPGTVVSTAHGITCPCIPQLWGMGEEKRQVCASALSLSTGRRVVPSPFYTRSEIRGSSN